MPNSVLPEDITLFLLENINSIPELEGLLLFFRNSDDSLSTEIVSERLYIQNVEAESIVKALFDKGLITKSDTKPPQFIYSPQSLEVKNMIPRLAQAYSDYLLPVTFLIHSKPKSRIHEFANAFWIRKD